MNYQQHYALLISTRLYLQYERNQLRKLRYKQKPTDRTCASYFENHHIIPKCVNGTNDKSNTILLTDREHYISHWLLMKIYPKDYKLAYALHRLSHDKQNNHINHNSKKYKLLKNNFAIAQGIRPISDKTRAKLSSSGKGRKATPEARHNMSIAQQGLKHKPMSDVGKKNIGNARKGCIGPWRDKKLSDSHKANISKSQMNSKNWIYNIDPWLSPSVTSNLKCIKIWNMLNIFYQIWILSGKPKSVWFHKVCKMNFKYLDLNENLEYTTIPSLVQWFIDNGNPMLYEPWRNYIVNDLMELDFVPNIKTNDPWNHHFSQKPETQELWLNADLIFDIWNINSNISHSQLLLLASNKRLCDNKISIRNLIKWFRTHDDPRNNDSWVSFKKTL